MAESAELNILIETGADFVMYKTIRDDQENPVDLTGASISSHLREFAEAADYFEFACMHNGPGGKVTITMPHETTAQIAFATGVYDVKVVLADGFTTYTLHGDAVIREGVTKFYDGKVLFMVGIGEYDDLPEVGNVNRLYFVYEDRKIYRWNGSNYIATSVGNGIQRIDYLDGGTYRMVFDDGTYFDFESVPRLMGTHDSTQEYQKLDVVMAANGASYIALVPVPENTAITDTNYWMQITPKLPTVDAEDVSFDYAQSHNDLVTISGTAKDPHLHYKVPRGVTGNESIDDNAGENDTDVVWSADRSYRATQDKYHATTGSFSFVNGYINTAGSNSNSNQEQRGRTPQYYELEDNVTYIKVIPASGVWWLGRVYNKSDSSFVGSICMNTNDYFTAAIDIYINPEYKYRFVVRKEDDSEFDAPTLPANTLTYIAYHCTDKSLTLSGKPADAKVTGDHIGAINSQNLMINTLYPKTEAKKNRISVVNPNYCVRMAVGSGVLSPAMHGIRHTLSDASKMPGIYFGNNSNKLFTVLDQDKYYTLSFDYFSKVSIDCNLNIYKVHGDSSTYKAFNISALTADEEASGHFALTFSYLDYNEDMYLRICPTVSREGDFGNGDYVEIRNVMLVEGQIETAWKPAPSDYADNQTSDDTVSRNDPPSMEDKLQQLTRRYKEYQGDFKTKILCLLHFSDIHGERKGLQNVMNFYGYYQNYIDDVLHTGDIVRSRYNNGIDFWNAVEGSENILNCIGNHDTSMSSGGVTDWLAISMAQAYQTFYAPYIANWGVVSEEDKTYYYKDYVTENVRLIVLDGCRHAVDDQFNWFVNTLADARTNGYHVLCACHIRPGYVIEPYDTTWDDKPVVDSYPVNTDSSGRSTYAGNLADRYAAAVDSFMNDGGEFIAWLHGHIHYKMFYTLGNHPNQLCVGVSAQLINYDFMNCARIASTKSEDDFYIVGIDTYSKLFRMVKVGVAYDRKMRHTDVLCFDYENHKLITSN